MKTLALGVLAVAVAALVAVQHQQLGQLRAENVTLQQASAEADQLKADLAKSTGAQADAEDEITRLREENRDLLRLRNQVYQLREATTQFEQVSADNQRLRAVAQSAPRTATKDELAQPIIILIQNLSNQGLRTPEAAAQTFFWAERDGNIDALSNCILPEHVAEIQDVNPQQVREGFTHLESIEIVARRDPDANTVQLGIQIIPTNNSGSGQKFVLTLKLRDGEWKLDVVNLNNF
jgi:hypothetical protein